jgi:hypothetical protein
MCSKIYKILHIAVLALLLLDNTYEYYFEVRNLKFYVWKLTAHGDMTSLDVPVTELKCNNTGRLHTAPSNDR